MKKGKHPTSKTRNRKKKVKATYAKAREEAQLMDVIPTEPAGAVRDERVNPSTQDEQRFPGLDRAAIMGDGKGWAVNDAIKRKIIEKNAEVLYERKVFFDKDGNERELPPDRAAIEKASRVLLQADQTQFERDDPERAGKAKGAVNVGVAVLNWDDLTKRPVTVDPLQQALNLLEDKSDVDVVQSQGTGKVGTGGSDGPTAADNPPGFSVHEETHSRAGTNGTANGTGN